MSVKDANEWAGQVLTAMRESIFAVDNLILLGTAVFIAFGFLFVLVMSICAGSQLPKIPSPPPAAWPPKKN